VAAAAAVPDALEADTSAADEEIADRLVVRQAVEELPDPRRTILFLAFWEQRSHAEIAETVGLPLGTVKSHVRRGLVKLHQQLEGVRHESR
jgi:RNA polymerase sigma-70 factor (ECF subfamily)